MTGSADDTDPARPEGRWAFIRDLVMFQVKLLLDALRDIVLSPISIVVGLIDLASGDDPPGRNFNRLLAVGRRSDSWINLFGEQRHEGEGEGVDSLVSHLERLLVDQVERGGVTASAKEAIDRSLDRGTRTRRDRRTWEPR
jgi:hypothetical protein